MNGIRSKTEDLRNITCVAIMGALSGGPMHWDIQVAKVISCCGTLRTKTRC